MKKLLTLLLAMTMLTACFALTSCGGNNTGDAEVTVNSDGEYLVGICQLIQHPALDAATQGFMDTLKAEFGDKVSFINQNAQGDSSTCTTIVTSLVTQKVDLIMANATPALSAAASGTSEIPVLGTSITEYGIALGIDNFDGTVGGNVSGTSDLAPLDKQADMLEELYPAATHKNVGLLYCTAEPNSAYQVREIKKLLTEKGYTCTEYGFADSGEVNSVANAAASGSDVIYVPTDNTVANCASAVLGSIGNKPLIAGESGICSGCGVATMSIDYYKLGVTTGEMAIEILKGEKSVSNMAVKGYQDTPTKQYNARRCEELGMNIADLEAKGYTVIPGTEIAG